MDKAAALLVVGCCSEDGLAALGAAAFAEFGGAHKAAWEAACEASAP